MFLLTSHNGRVIFMVVIEPVYKHREQWYLEWQRVTANDNEWCNEWYSEWQTVVILVNFSFFWIREEPTTKHPKEKSLNLAEDLEEELLN